MVTSFADNAIVLYNKFNVDGSSPPVNPPRHPNSDYNCVVATADHWRVVHCDVAHHVVCHSDHFISGIAFAVTLRFAIRTNPLRATWLG